MVHDRDEWWEIKRRKVRTAVPAGGSGEDEGHSIHLPQPSYWPIVASTGLLIGGLGLIFSIAAAAVGGAITMFAIYAWSFEPVNDPDEGAAH